MDSTNQNTNQNENLATEAGNDPRDGIRPPKVKPNKHGRPTKLTPEVHEMVVAAIRAGNYMETAAAFAGVHKATLYTWLKRGTNTKKSTVYSRFHDAIKKALAEAEVRDIQTILAAAETQWQAAAWHRERMSPNKWGRVIRSEVKQEVTQGEQRTLAGKSVEELDKIVSGEETPDPTFLTNTPDVPTITDDEENDNDADTDPDTSDEGAVAG